MKYLPLVLLLAACRPGPYPEDAETPRLDGYCGPGAMPWAVVVERDGDLYDYVADAAAQWGDNIFWMDPDRDERDCDDGWLICRHTALVVRQPLEPGVRGEADVVADYGRPVACVARVASDWPLSVDVIAHELGHCLGLDHSRDEDSVMHEPVLERSWVTDADIAGAWSDYCEP